MSRVQRRYVWFGVLCWRVAAYLPGGRWSRLGRMLVGLGNRAVVITLNGRRV